MVPRCRGELKAGRWKTRGGGCKLPARKQLTHIRTGVRVAEGAGLENRYTGNGIVGSNPTLSVLPIDGYYMIGLRVVRSGNRLKSRSAVKSSDTPCARQSAAMRASCTRGPVTCPASTAFLRMGQ